MNEKQIEHFSGNENQTQQYKIEVTIKPSITKNTQNQRAKETPIILYSNMAGNLKMNQNPSQSNNIQSHTQEKNTQIVNLQSKVTIPSNYSNNPKSQEKVSKNNLNSSAVNPLTVSPYKNPNLVQHEINTINIQETSEVQQKPTSNSQRPPQSLFNMQQISSIQLAHPESILSLFQTPIQQILSQANVGKPKLKISGYRINQNNQIEYEILMNDPNLNPLYCPSSQFVEFEPIRQFWLHNNGHDEKNPRQPRSKKKKKVASNIDYSSDSPSNSPPRRKSKTSLKLDEKETSLKISETDMPPLLSFDKEPKVNIVGVVQKEPVIKIAVQFEKSQTLTVITAAEAKKKFPMQLSKFYEKFVTFVDYE